MNSLKIRNFIVLIIMAITLFNCKKKDELMIVIPKTTEVIGNPYSEKGLQIDGKIDIQGEYEVVIDSVKNVALLKNSNGVIAGEFSCECSSGVVGCRFESDISSFRCVTTICDACSLTITISTGQLQLYYQ